MRVSIFALLAFITTTASFAEPIEYRKDGFSARISGYGNFGMIEPDFALANSMFMGDWSLRGQMSYDVNETYKLGMVYSLNQQTIDDDEYINDLFALWQVKNLGRLEIGLTDSVAEKLGLGLPDVGGLRLNDNPMFYKEIKPRHAVIADTILDTGDGAPRVNVVTTQHNGVQYGLSVAGGSDDYKFAIDGGIKIRRPDGKTKTAYSIGFSFMNKPDDFQQSQFSPNVTADWRAQFSAAVNVQYNSFMFALTGRAIYDENPIGVVSDGIILGTGVSYDLLKYNVSLSYMLSDTGIWDKDVDDYLNHTVVSSFRYKYSENVDGWISLGVTSKTEFISAGMRITF
ncbi:MAG: hypothetical protein IKP05_00175 [Alphaproteobacteria bacterium]|nr:hypothetical protein [Alphaproteobacteria bacterium]